VRFIIHPQIDGTPITLQVEKIAAPPGKERYRIAGANRSVTLETNRLLFKSKGLKHRKGTWSVIEGEMRKRYAMDKICNAIEQADAMPQT